VTQTADPEAGYLTAAAEMLRSAKRIAVMAHLNPDADAIGSTLGLTLGLRALGKQVTPVLSDPVPEYALFLEGAAAIGSALPPEDSVDLLVCLDAAGVDRVGRVYEENPERFERQPVLNVDHHRTNPLFGTSYWVDPGASSTSEMVFRLLSGLGGHIEAAAANALLFGITGDTGSFQNGATTPGSLIVAGELVKLGANSQQIAYFLFERKRFAAARLWGKMIAGVELDPERKIVFCFMTQQMLLDAGASVDETEGVAEYLRGVEEAEVVMLLKEEPDGSVRVSMRSRPTVDVSAIASELGGGGHRQAAGCTLPGPMGEARRLLVATFDALASR
jgi:phosphoesterase RecJ-like protein